MSETLILCPESIDAYKTLLTHPADHGLTFRPLAECFRESDTVTPKHELYATFINYLQKPLPKVMFYIIMDELYSSLIDVEKLPDGTNGNLGYKLAFIEDPETSNESESPSGICHVCGCTNDNPCYNPNHGNCWWADDTHTICNHCANEEIKNDPATEHCINDGHDDVHFEDEYEPFEEDEDE